jgi:hypothetical protein
MPSISQDTDLSFLRLANDGNILLPGFRGLQSMIIDFHLSFEIFRVEILYTHFVLLHRN